MLSRYAKQCNSLSAQMRTECNRRIFVETGTYRGDMIDALINHFDLIYSIELDKNLHNQARFRFRRYPHVVLIHGDSGLEMESLVNRINEPALFWLDGHYSGGVTAEGVSATPIFNELHHILKDTINGHVVIIDDARHFGVNKGYPSIDQLRAFVLSKRNADFSVQDDMIRISLR
jgi:hypothetical protein